MTIVLVKCFGKVSAKLLELVSHQHVTNYDPEIQYLYSGYYFAFLVSIILGIQIFIKNSESCNF